MNSKRIYILIIIGLLIWNGVLTASLNNDKKDKKESGVIVNEVIGYSTDLTRVVDKVKSSTVALSSTNGLSSGFIYKKSGNTTYVITAGHAVYGTNALTVHLDNGVKVDGKLVGIDILTDIAVVSFESDYEVKTVTFGDNDLLKAGEFTIVMGTPTSLDFKNSIELALVSDKSRFILNKPVVDGIQYSNYQAMIQLSTEIMAGYSGAPVFNMNGDVVGAVLMKTAGAETMALCGNEVKIVADNLVEEGTVTKYMLNAKISFIKDMENYKKTNLNIGLDVTHGAYVESVLSSSIANSLGIKSGDVILDINNRPIVTSDDYLHALYEKTNTFIFRIYRNGEITEVGGVNND